MERNRDIRDPKELGKRLEDLRDLNDLHGEPGTPLSLLCDLNGLGDVPDYQGTTLGQVTAQTYLDELQSREAQGDRYAASTLAAMQAGMKLDPEIL